MFQVREYDASEKVEMGEEGSWGIRRKMFW